MAQSAQVAKLNPWHRTFADWLIADGGTPGWGKRAAAHFGRTQSWISTVYHSDAFQDYYIRYAEEASASLAQSVRDKMLGITGMALDQIGEKLETQASVSSIPELLQVVDTVGKRAGFGIASQAPQAATVVNVINGVSKRDLEVARDAMRIRAQSVELLPAPEAPNGGGDATSSRGAEVHVVDAEVTPPNPAGST